MTMETEKRLARFGLRHLNDLGRRIWVSSIPVTFWLSNQDTVPNKPACLTKFVPEARWMDLDARRGGAFPPERCDDILQGGKTKAQRSRQVHCASPGRTLVRQAG